MTVQEVYAAAQALSLDERYELLHLLEQGLESAAPGTLSPEWKTEIERRWADYKADPSTATPWETVRERVMSKAKRRA